MDWSTLGKHRYKVEADLCIVETCGPVQAEEMQQLMMLMTHLDEKYGHVLGLFDVTKGASLPAESRRVMARWDRRGRPPAPTAIVGAGTALSTMVVMAIHAIRIFTGKLPSLAFFKQQTDALAWLAEQRAMLISSPSPLHP
jgi:hypothetical protein